MFTNNVTYDITWTCCKGKNSAIKEKVFVWAGCYAFMGVLNKCSFFPLRWMIVISGAKLPHPRPGSNAFWGCWVGGGGLFSPYGIKPFRIVYINKSSAFLFYYET